MTTNLDKYGYWNIIPTGIDAIPSHDMAADALNVSLGLETEEAQVILHEIYSIVKKLLEFCKHLFHLRNGRQEGKEKGRRREGRNGREKEQGREKRERERTGKGDGGF